MHKKFAFFVVAFCCISKTSAIEVMQPLPPLEIQEITQSKGQFVYIDFWASWCGPCRQSFPWMNTLHAKYGARGLKVIAINVDAKRGDADKFLSYTPAQFAIAYDAKGESAKRLAVKAMPTSLLVNPDGQVVMIHAGFHPNDSKKIETFIDEELTKNR